MVTVRFTQTGDGENLMRMYEVISATISAEEAVNVLCDLVERLGVALESANCGEPGS